MKEQFWRSDFEKHVYPFTLLARSVNVDVEIIIGLTISLLGHYLFWVGIQQVANFYISHI